MKTLVVDDEAHIRRLLEVLLKGAGHDVLIACDGATGLQMIETERPRVVVSDVMLPVMNGLDMCKQAARFKEENPFLTILLTGRMSNEEREWADQASDTLYIQKPFSPMKLVDVIEKYASG